MLRPSPNHGTQRLPNDDDEQILFVINNGQLLVRFVYERQVIVDIRLGSADGISYQLSRRIESCVAQRSLGQSYTPFKLALLIRSETGFAPMRAFTLHQLIRISDFNRI